MRQRELVRQALLLKHNEVDFQLAETNSAKDFEPKVGELPQVFRSIGLWICRLREPNHLATFVSSKQGAVHRVNPAITGGSVQATEDFKKQSLSGI
jgi:hypothetical protein